MSLLQELKARAHARRRRAQLVRTLESTATGSASSDGSFDDFGAPEGGFGRLDLAAADQGAGSLSSDVLRAPSDRRHN